MTDPMIDPARSAAMSRDLKYLFVATALLGAAGGVVMAALNNYLADVHHMTAEGRGWLEFPRELPGFLMIFVTGALLTVFRETRIAAWAMLLTAAGIIGLGLMATDTVLLVAFIIVWSMGDHIILAVEGTIGLRLAREGALGRRLGQLGGARHAGIIAGVGAMYLTAKVTGDRYDIFFIGAGVCAVLAAVAFAKIHIGKNEDRSHLFVLKKKYSLFYAISALFGVRKQIFLAFGGWVLVKIYNVPVSTIAMLYFIAAVIGVVARPLLGDVIDWLGERVVLAADEVFLIVVCLAYAFSGDLFSPGVAVIVLYGAYILDSVLFALRIARTTYLKKIADSDKDITPTIAMGITVDHVVAMTLPVLSGYLWENLGFRWVFILAAAIALAGFFICLRIRVPVVKKALPAQA